MKVQMNVWDRRFRLFLLCVTILYLVGLVHSCLLFTGLLPQLGTDLGDGYRVCRSEEDGSVFIELPPCDEATLVLDDDVYAPSLTGYILTESFILLRVSAREFISPGPGPRVYFFIVVKAFGEVHGPLDEQSFAQRSRALLDEAQFPPVWEEPVITELAPRDTGPRGIFRLLALFPDMPLLMAVVGAYPVLLLSPFLTYPLYVVIVHVIRSRHSGRRPAPSPE